MTDQFSTLLEVQDHDTAIDQLQHRRKTLPARAELANVEQSLAELARRVAVVRAERDDLGSRQEEIERQVEASRSRRAQLERQMMSGAVSASRDLQAMNEEVRHLGQYISELEDREIELMEALEPLDATIEAAHVERSSLEAAASRLRAQIAAAEEEIDKELSVHGSQRDEAARAVPQDLLARYEAIRSKLGGTGAARLIGGSCGGCHLSLPAMEVDRIRKAPPDEVITCEQCGRILVR